MAIITAAGLTDLYNQRTFNKNGSTVTLKKISDTDWILFGDLAEGDSEGFGEAVASCLIQLEMPFPIGDGRNQEIGFRIVFPEAGDWPYYPYRDDPRWSPPLNIFTNQRILFNYERDNSSNNFGSLPEGVPEFIRTLTLSQDGCSGELIVWASFSPEMSGGFTMSLIKEGESSGPSGDIYAYQRGGGWDEHWNTGEYWDLLSFSGMSLCVRMDDWAQA